MVNTLDRLDENPENEPMSAGSLKVGDKFYKVGDKDQICEITKAPTSVVFFKVIKSSSGQTPDNCEINLERRVVKL